MNVDLPSISPTSHTPDQKQIAHAWRQVPSGAGVRDLSAAIKCDTCGRITASKSALHAYLQHGGPLPAQVVVQLKRTLTRLLRDHLREAQQALEAVSGIV